MRKQTTLLAAMLLIGMAVLFYAFVKPDNRHALEVVNITTGKVSGVANADGDVVSFKGIPFAAPPAGQLRWKAPQPAKPWTGIKKCDAFGPSPMQGKPTPFMVYTPEFLIPEQPISEDCLYLNVWTNAKAAADKKPVLVWIYGGGFTSGGSAVPIYDGEAMAKKDVIFVSVNYRVGVFGFLAHPELTKESGHNASGNYGLLDQVAALKWIKQNIAHFGGDPQNVTIAGQSAGSMSVNALVASPLAKGLFQKAIAESGSLTIGSGAIDGGGLKQAEEQGTKLAKAAGAASLQALRQMPAEEVMKKMQGRFSPIVDGYVLPEPIPAIFAAGKQNQVPVITGWNADEAFIGGLKNKDEYVKQIREQYGSKADEFLKYFPGSTDEEAAASQVKISRNQIFALSGYNWAKIQSSQTKAPVYLYYFERKVPATPEYEKYGAFHTAEVAYALGDLKFLKRPLVQTDFELSNTMSSYWANFAKTGNPNGSGLPEWPAFNSGEAKAMIFNERSGAGNLPDKAGLDLMLAQASKK